MEVTILFFTLSVLAVLYVWVRRSSYCRRFQHIPGPKETWLLGNALQIRTEEFHRQLYDWYKQFGPIYKIRLPDTYMIVLSGYEELWDMFQNTGLDLAGRYNNFRMSHHVRDTGLGNRFPDGKWKLLRKIVHKQLKQYGEGMKTMEKAVAEISEYMFLQFSNASDAKRTLDPFDIFKRTAVKIIALVACGERLADDHPLVNSLIQYEENVWDMLGDLSLGSLLIDIFPLALNLPIRASRKLKHLDNIRDRLARELGQLGLKHEGSLMTMLHDCKNNKKESRGVGPVGVLHEDDIMLTLITILFAAVGTSSLSFYCLINILAHRKDVQEKLWNEIRTNSPDPKKNVNLLNRPEMPYSRAVIYELLRYHSPAPINGLRLAVKESEIRGIRIPEGTVIAPNTWTLHHDPDSWDEPEHFKPERFLDNEGNLLAPNHQRRKHLLPFSSGVRVCPGEQFALARLFLWLTNLVKRFEIIPAEDNDVSKIDPDNFRLAFLLYPPRYHVLPKRRSGLNTGHCTG